MYFLLWSSYTIDNY